MPPRPRRLRGEPRLTSPLPFPASRARTGARIESIRFDDVDENSTRAHEGPGPSSSSDRFDSALAGELVEYWDTTDAELLIFRFGRQLVAAVHRSLARMELAGSLEVRKSRSGLFVSSLWNAWRQAGSPPLAAPQEFTRPLADTDPDFVARIPEAPDRLDSAAPLDAAEPRQEAQSG